MKTAIGIGIILAMMSLMAILFIGGVLLPAEKTRESKISPWFYLRWIKEKVMKRFPMVVVPTVVIVLALAACSWWVKPAKPEFQAPVAAQPSQAAVAPEAPKVPSVIALKPEIKSFGPVLEGRIRVGFFRDRPDEFFWRKYDEEFGRTAPRTPYFRTVRALGHEALAKELLERPQVGGTFNVFVLDKDGKVLLAKQAVTNPGGWADVEIGPLDKVGKVRIQVDWKVVRAGTGIIPSREEGDVFVLPAELQQHDPLYVWFVQTKRPTP